MADQHRPLQSGDCHLDIFGEHFEAHRPDRLASAITEKIECDRLIATGRKARHLRRERARADADAMQENDRDHSGFPSRAETAGSPRVCISRLAQANIATAWVRSRMSKSVSPCSRSGAASAGPIEAGSRVSFA